MKNLFLLGCLVCLPLFSFAQWVAPEVPGEVCVDEPCTQEMKRIYDGFQKNPHPPIFVPGMYSGVCYHQSKSLNPEITHYVGLLIDRLGNGLYMAPIMQYFGEENSMSHWTLEQARKESSPDWKKWGPMTQHTSSGTQAVLDEEGFPVYVYWARQNLQTQAIYFLSFARGWSFAFCEAFPNAGGLEN